MIDKTITRADFLRDISSDAQSEAISDVRNTCYVDPVLVMLQGKWKSHIFYEMYTHNSMRFGELKRALPEITNTMLTTTLRELESYDLIRREQFNEIPPRVEYSMTERGEDLLPIFFEIFRWGLKHNV